MREWMNLINEAQDPMAQFRAWFQGSYAVDERGHPLLLYRGEHGDNSGALEFHTKRGSLSFGTVDAANLYATKPNDVEDMNRPTHSPRVFPCYLSIKNPVFNSPDDPFIDLDKLEDIIGHEEILKVIENFTPQIENTTAWEEVSRQYENVLAAYLDGADLCIYCFELLDEAYYVDLFKRLGYDGAIHMGTGETSFSTEYKIFDASQAVSIFAVANMQRPAA